MRFAFRCAILPVAAKYIIPRKEGEETIQWGGNYATEFATSRPPKPPARCPNRKWIKSIEVQFRSGVVDIIGNSAIMIMAGNSAQNSDRERERERSRVTKEE